MLFIYIITILVGFVKFVIHAKHTPKSIFTVMACDTLMPYRIKTCNKNMDQIYSYRSSH